ncbi:MAG TPA: protoporphyrinogen oxidase [Anaerolineales bacterium]|nr:protoporphyrinogen oxidase [Anaerolineales bacterium]
MAAHIVVIGGGISGLSAAYDVNRLLPDAQVTVLERELRWGGKILSETVPLPDGGACLIEGGAESFVTRKPEVWDLVHELGIADQMRLAPNAANGTCVLDEGRIRRIPLDPVTFLTTGLLSPAGKARMLLEPLIAARRDAGDESLADFVDRRLGREARERFIGPVLGGIYNTDPEVQSLLTTAPVMRELEQHGSLVWGSAVRMWERRSAPRRPAFISFKHGTQALTDGLAAAFGGTLRAGVTAEALSRQGGRWQIATSEGASTLSADAVIFTTPANAAASLLAEVAPAAAALLRTIHHNHIGTLSLVYRDADLPRLNLSGLMIPRRERRPIDAITRFHAPNPRVPEGYTLLKVFFGGGDPRTAELDEPTLIERVGRELDALLAIKAQPVAWRVYRWHSAFPQAAVGHLDLVDDIEAALPAGLFVAGAAFRGIGVPDCIRQARAVAGRLAQPFLKR